MKKEEAGQEKDRRREDKTYTGTGRRKWKKEQKGKEEARQEEDRRKEDRTYTGT